MQIVKIPSERVLVLLGEGGQVKAYLERRMNLLLKVDKDGAVILEGESIDEYLGKDVIRAIGRGFSPDVALKLLSDEYGFRIIDLRDYAKDQKGRHRIMGRIIGEKGKTKKIIEEGANADIACYGHTVSVISKLETLDYATEAIFRLIDGSSHASVYHFIEKCRRKIKENELRKLFGK
jgi:ribosomal RNA assembly protein